MEDELPSKSTCYVFDASSLIELEGVDGKGLRYMPAYPGKWLVVPSKVAKEVNSKGAPTETRKWLMGGRPSTFNVDNERRIFMRIRAHEKLLSDADIEGIVLTFYRKGTYVVEEERAISVAKSLGVITIKANQFLDEIRPHLL